MDDCDAVKTLALFCNVRATVDVSFSRHRDCWTYLRHCFAHKRNIIFPRIWLDRKAEQVAPQDNVNFLRLEVN